MKEKTTEGKTSSPARRKVTLRSSDGEIFQVEEQVAAISKTLKNMIDNDCSDGVIPVSNVTGKILKKVLEYCKRHAAGDDKSEHYFFGTAVNGAGLLEEWDNKFIEEVDQNTLFDLILAANYLDIEELLEKGCGVVAGMMKGKSPENLREIFHIKNDFSADEEEELRRQISWAFH